MDYSNEEWIKVYKRNTASWLSMSIGARGVALELSRSMGRFTDEISLGSKGLKALAPLLAITWAELEPLLDELFVDNHLVYDEQRQVLRDPEHIARQEARASVAQRKRDSRARVKKDPPQADGDDEERPVGRSLQVLQPEVRHTLSRAVTPASRPEEKRSEQNRERPRERAHEPPPISATPVSEKREVRSDEPLTEARRADALEQAGGISLDVDAVWKKYVTRRLRDGVRVANLDFDWRGWVLRELDWIRERGTARPLAKGPVPDARASRQLHLELEGQKREAARLSRGERVNLAGGLLAAVGG